MEFWQYNKTADYMVGVLKEGADGGLLAQGFSSAFRKQILLEDEKLWSMISPLPPLYSHSPLQTYPHKMLVWPCAVGVTLSKTFARIQIGDSCEEKDSLLFICINTSLDFLIHFTLQSRPTLLVTERITSKETWPARGALPRQRGSTTQIRNLSCSLLPIYHHSSG